MDPNTPFLPASIRQELLLMANQVNTFDYLASLFLRGSAVREGPTTDMEEGPDGNHGELAMSLRIDEARHIIVVDFGTPIVRFTLQASHAWAIAQVLNQMADKLKNARSAPC